MSSFIGIEPVNDVKRYDAKQHKYIDVPRLYIVKQYNSYMGGIDKLDIMSALYKARIKSRRWYIYIWLHSVTIAVVNTWLLYRRDQSIHGTKKTLKQGFPITSC